jgi:precorrin-4/cobalt-precorrin-4 C11-methyltransferase
MTSVDDAPLISFVGAGPGAADLITLRGANRLAQADIVVWASALVPEAVLAHVNPTADISDSAAMTLEDAFTLYERNADARIVSLHSGDPSVHGAISEQIEWCVSNERSFEIIPGVSSVSAAAALLGKELTVPGVAESVVLTMLGSRTSSSVRDNDRIAVLASLPCTLAVFLSTGRRAALQEELLSDPSGLSRGTPALVVVHATWPDEQIVETTVGGLADAIADTGATETVLVLVGDALRNVGNARNHVYSPAFAHGYRKRTKPAFQDRVSQPIPTT